MCKIFWKLSAISYFINKILNKFLLNSLAVTNYSIWLIFYTIHILLTVNDYLNFLYVTERTVDFTKTPSWNERWWCHTQKVPNSVNSLGEYTHLLHCLLPTFHLPFHPHFSIHKIIGMTQTFSTNNSIHFSVFSIKMRLQ